MTIEFNSVVTLWDSGLLFGLVLTLCGHKLPSYFSHYLQRLSLKRLLRDRKLLQVKIFHCSFERERQRDRENAD